MIYNIRANSNYTWNIQAENNETILTVKKIIFKVPISAVTKGTSSNIGTTSYNGFIQIDYSKPLIIQDGIIIFD